MRLIKNKKIAIIGGGPGGLTLARLLQMTGADVQVYERDFSKDARVQGATLDLHEESGLRALKAAGLMAAFRANYRPGAEQLRIMDKKAHIAFEDHPKTEEEIARPEIDRGPLQHILLESLQPGTVIWNSHFDGLIPQNNSWTLTFKNGTAASADIVVGADGARSKVRPYITPVQPFYSGITVVEGTVYDSATNSPIMHGLLKGGKIFALDEDKSLIVSSKGDGSLVFYAGYKMEEHWIRHSGIDFGDNAQVLGWFKEAFTNWNVVYQELFERAITPYVCRPLYCMPLDQTWESLSNLTILGDAAHLMPPFAGEGVNMAMLDALKLAQCLTSDHFSDLYSAIASFEKEMRARASESAKESLDASEILHSPEAIPFLGTFIIP